MKFLYYFRNRQNLCDELQNKAVVYEILSDLLLIRLIEIMNMNSYLNSADTRILHLQSIVPRNVYDGNPSDVSKYFENLFGNSAEWLPTIKAELERFVIAYLDNRQTHTSDTIILNLRSYDQGFIKNFREFFLTADRLKLAEIIYDWLVEDTLAYNFEFIPVSAIRNFLIMNKSEMVVWLAASFVKFEFIRDIDSELKDSDSVAKINSLFFVNDKKVKKDLVSALIIEGKDELIKENLQSKEICRLKVAEFLEQYLTAYLLEKEKIADEKETLLHHLVELADPEAAANAISFYNLVFDCADSYPFSIFPDSRFAVLIDSKALFDILRVRESVFNTNKKYICLVKTSLSTFNMEMLISDIFSDLETFLSKDDKGLLVCATDSKVLGSEYSLYECKQESTPSFSGIVLENVRKEKIQDYMNYYYDISFPITNKFKEFLLKEMKISNYNIIPATEFLLLGASGVKKSSIGNSLFAEVIAANKVYGWRLTKDGKLDKMDSYSSNAITLIKVMISEVVEDFGISDLKESLNGDINYFQVVLPYNKFGYILNLFKNIEKIAGSNRLIGVFFDSLSEQLLGEWTKNDLNRTAQLKSEGLNSIARSDFLLFHKLIQESNIALSRYGSQLFVIATANTDTAKSTFFSQALVGGVTNISGSLYNEGDYLDKQALLPQIRVRQNNVFVSGIMPYSSVINLIEPNKETFSQFKDKY